MREFGDFSEASEGSLVSVDLESLSVRDTLSSYSKNPGDTTFVSDSFDGPGDLYSAWGHGLAFGSQGCL